MMEELEKNKKKGGEPNRDELNPLLKNRWLYTLMKEKLNENACRNRGFVLDGFPRTFKDAQKTFLVKKKIYVTNEDGEEVLQEEEEEEPESNSDEEGGDEEVPAEEKKERNYDNYECDPAITPRSFVRLDGEDEFLKTRVKDLPEETVTDTHWNDADMDRRLKAYREANNSEVDDPNLTTFFEKYDIQNFSSNCEEEQEKLFEAFKIFIEKLGKPFNYMSYDDKKEEERQSQVDQSRKESDKDGVETGKE